MAERQRKLAEQRAWGMRETGGSSFLGKAEGATVDGSSSVLEAPVIPLREAPFPPLIITRSKGLGNGTRQP